MAVYLSRAQWNCRPPKTGKSKKMKAILLMNLVAGLSKPKRMK